jgi:hypothetical protein
MIPHGPSLATQFLLTTNRFSARYPERQAKEAAGELRLAARVGTRPGILVWPEFGRISVACGAILKYHPSKA